VPKKNKRKIQDQHCTLFNDTQQTLSTREFSHHSLRTKHRGDDFSSTSGRSDASSQEDWESSETDREETRGGPKKLHWEAGPGSVIGERALMNQLAQRMRERGADWERVRNSSV
jgi:hypothetical protein